MLRKNGNKIVFAYRMQNHEVAITNMIKSSKWKIISVTYLEEID